MLIDHRNQQIVLRKTQYIESCFGTNVGTDQAKFEKISISRAIWLGFLRSLVSAIRCEANESNRRREERPIGSRAIKMLRDLPRGFARSRTECGGGERARRRESTYAQLVDMMSTTVAHNRLRDGSLENATCVRVTNQAKLNAWRGKSRSFSQLGFSRSLDSATSNKANESAMLRAD